MSYIWNEPARPVDFKESSIVAALKKGPLTVMPKADGCRLHIVINDSGDLFLRSRADLPFPALRELEAQLNAPGLRVWRLALAGYTIEGEAMVKDADGNLLPCEKTSGRLQAHEQLRGNQLDFLQFDLHHPGIAKMGKGQRLQHKQSDMHFLLYGHLGFSRLPTYTVNTLQDLDEWYEVFRSAGFEGAVAVPQNAPYANGKKVGAGWKVKPSVTVEGTITGVLQAFSEEGKPLGRVGSFEVTYEDGTVGKGGAGAMTHDDRRHYWEHQEEAIGRIAEWTAMEKFAKGGMRHPNWKHWRDMPEHKGVKI